MSRPGQGLAVIKGGVRNCDAFEARLLLCIRTKRPSSVMNSRLLS
jgi:hypothetical protein